MSNKFHQLRLHVEGKVDIPIISETKLDSTCPSLQFTVDGHSKP